MRSPRDPQSGSGTGIHGWALVVVAICVLWLAAMVAASYCGLEYKTPTRIESWRPASPAP
jgi:heme A synthase